MQYVIKLGAYGLAGVAAFAVAVALMLSVSSTPTAEALIVQDRPDGTGTRPSHQTVPPNNGDTRLHPNEFDNDGYVRRSTIEHGRAAASASFTHADASEDGQSILCGVGH